MNQPLVSIGLPCYRAKDLARAIDCMLAQTHTNWELYLCNNASPEPEVETICQRYAASDARIHYYKQPAPVDVSSNFMTAFELAKNGAYFMWATDDDIWFPEFIAYCVNALEQNGNAGFAFPNMLLITDEQKVIAETGFAPFSAGRSFSSVRYLWSNAAYSYKACLIYGLFRRPLLESVLKKAWAPCQYQRLEGDGAVVYGMLAAHGAAAGGPVLMHKFFFDYTPLFPASYNWLFAATLGRWPQCIHNYLRAAPSIMDRFCVMSVFLLRMLQRIFYGMPLRLIDLLLKNGPATVLRKLKNRYQNPTR